MTGDRVIDEGVEFEVVYDGAHRGRNADLFNPIDEPGELRVWSTLPEDDKPRRNFAGKRDELLTLLRQQPRWRVKALRDALQVDSPTIANLLQQLDARGLIQRVDYGVVGLRPHARRAA